MTTTTGREFAAAELEEIKIDWTHSKRVRTVAERLHRGRDKRGAGRTGHPAEKAEVQHRRRTQTMGRKVPCQGEMLCRDAAPRYVDAYNLP